MKNTYICNFVFSVLHFPYISNATYLFAFAILSFSNKYNFIDVFSP